MGPGGGTASRPSSPPALHPVSASPRGVVLGDAVVRLRFSAPLAAATGSTAPRIKPALAGHWSQPTPTTLQFTPTGAYLPGTTVIVTLPKGFSAATGARRIPWGG